MNQSIKDMLNGENCTSVPQDILEFMESQFDLKNYEKTKASYLSLMTVKNDKLLSHLKTSYHIAEFWKHMYLTEINQVDLKPVVKTEPCSSPRELENSEDSPMPQMCEQESSSIEFAMEDAEDDVDEAEGENYDSSPESPWTEESAGTEETVSGNTQTDTFGADSTQHKIESVEEKNVGKPKWPRPKARKPSPVGIKRGSVKNVKELLEDKQGKRKRKNPSPGPDWRDLITNPPTFDAVTMEDFESVKKRWDQVLISKKAGNSSLYIQMRNELRNSLFKQGKLINLSTDALYFLHNERYLLHTRKRRRNIHTQVRCKICQKQLSSREHEHMRVAHGPEDQYPCPACDVTRFTHVKELIAHYRVTHWEDVPLSCNQCSEVAYSPKELQHHILRHSSLSKITCRNTECGFRFNDEEARHEHETKEHVYNKPCKQISQPRISWTCEFCGKVFSCKAESLKSAMKSHEISVHKEKLHKCGKCGKAFAQAGGLLSHIERCAVPPSLRRYTCVYKNCNKLFKTKADLRCHMLYHKPAKYPCGKCGRPFYFAKYLQDHKCPLDKE